MKRKIIEYLGSKAESESNELDKILQEYVDGQIEEIANKKGFTNVEIFPEISKKTRSMQIYFRYYNFAGFIEFEDEGYEYCIYIPDKKQMSYDEKDMVKNKYTSAFCIDTFFDQLYKNMIVDKRLDREDYLIKIKKNKKYKAFSTLSLIFTLVFILIVGTYVTITDKSLNSGLGVIAIAGLAFHVIFYYISTRYQ